MFDAVRGFVLGDYMPHGYCLLWNPALIWTHVVSDAIIALSYFSIPLVLVHFVRRRRDVEFGGVLLLFALFILACGTTHLMAIWVLWHGSYALEGAVKAVTAVASLGTAVLLWPLMPRMLAIPSPGQLQEVNRGLTQRIAERDAALAELKHEIARRETAEAALVQAQKMDAIGQLTGGIAHDFNNLLQSVSGNLELIAARPGDADKVSRWAGNALAGVQRGTRLTGQLLAFSRKQQMKLQPVEARALLGGMRDLLARSIGPSIALSIQGDADCPVWADPTQLELAVLNLAINARDAMPDGGRLVIAVGQVSLAADERLAPGD